MLKNVYLRKDRNGRQRAVAVLEDEDGTQRQVTSPLSSTRVGDARSEALEWAYGLCRGDEVTRSIPEANAPDPDAPETVVSYISRMIESMASSGAIEPSTASDYRSSLSRIERYLGGVPLSDLDRGLVSEMEAAMSESGLSSSTVGKAHRLIKQACSKAEFDGLIGRNPADGVKPPKRRNKKPGINYLMPDDRNNLLDVLDAAPPTPVTVAARVALFLGLREAEVCGLRWVDVDFESGALWVRRSIGVGKGGAYLKESKTDMVRDTSMPRRLSDALLSWRESQGRPPATRYILTGTDAFMHPTNLGRHWRALASLLGLKGSEGRQVTFHDLRHTWATVAVASGVDIKTVASNLGHVNAAMTLNIYASADPDAKRRAASIMDKAI